MGAENLTLAIAAGAGLLSFASPCVVPLVPGYLGYLSGTAAGQIPDSTAARALQRRRLVAHALSFVLGFTLVFTALGASVGLLGYAVRDMLPYIQKAGGIILIAFGLHTMRVITLPFLYREMRMDVRSVPRTWGYLSSVLIGAIFGAGWTPCIGVVLSGILTMAAASATVSQRRGCCSWPIRSASASRSWCVRSASTGRKGRCGGSTGVPGWWKLSAARS